MHTKVMGKQTSRSFRVGVSVRQGDALLTTPFNLTLQRVMQDIQILRSVVNWMTQLFGSADDVAVLSHCTAMLRELFEALEKAEMILGLQIN